MLYPYTELLRRLALYQVAPTPCHWALVAEAFAPMERRLVGALSDLLGREDAAQEVDTALALAARAYDVGRGSPYVAHELKCALLGHLGPILKRQKRLPKEVSLDEADEPSEAPTQESTLLTKEARRLIRERLDAAVGLDWITSETRDALILKHFEGLSPREVAEILGRDYEALRKQMNLALLRLAKVGQVPDYRKKARPRRPK